MGKRGSDLLGNGLGEPRDQDRLSAGQLLTGNVGDQSGRLAFPINHFAKAAAGRTSEVDRRTVDRHHLIVCEALHRIFDAEVAQGDPIQDFT
jgi:uncharacterized protein involved in propanediol utilization